MQFTTVRRKEKDYDIYLMSEKLVHSLQEHEKNVSHLFGLTNTVAAIQREKKVEPCYLETKNSSSQLLGARKTILTKNRFLAISSLTNTVAAIWREKKVDPCYLETKKCSSQLLGERKKIMTSI